MNALTLTASDRARAYLAQFPGAIQGQGGDHHTYKACCVLVNDFGLSEVEAWSIILEWNCRCVPPWNESDLRGKLRSALQCQHPSPRGNKLESGGQRFARSAVSSPAKEFPARESMPPTELWGRLGSRFTDRSAAETRFNQLCDQRREWPFSHRRRPATAFSGAGSINTAEPAERNP